MKKYFYLLLLIIPSTIFSQKNYLTIHGQVISNNIKEIEISGFEDNPIHGIGRSYTLPVENNNRFSITIAISHGYEGRIIAGMGTNKPINYSFFALPGDSIYINITGTKLDFFGKGAEKYRFLYQLEKERLIAYLDISSLNSGKISINEFEEVTKNFVQKRMTYFENYDKKDELEKLFFQYYKDQTDLQYRDLLIGLIKYVFFKGRPIIPYLEKYKEQFMVSHFTNDKLVKYPGYINIISHYIYYVKSIETCWKLKDLDHLSQCIEIVLTDSLTGTTRDYALANYICTDLVEEDHYDTTLINIFNYTSRDSFARKTVKKAIEKYKLEQLLIGKPLHPEFAQTKLADTANDLLTFGEMLEKYRGKVVYLEFWSLGCGPCIKAMPEARNLEQELKGLPIVFVYITADRYHNNLWNHIFKVSLTKDNHYRLIEGSHSKINKFMNTMLVPWYLLFDKEGRMITFSAEDPYHIKDTLLKYAKE